MEYPTTAQQADRTLQAIETRLKQGDVGGVMAEPIQGDAGIYVPYPGFFQALRHLLDRYGGLLIVDEVQSGMGRTGQWWAIEHEDVIPDLLVTAKGLSAGYAPISAIVGRQDVIDSLAPAQHLFTYSGHPPSVVVASRVIRLIEENGLRERATHLGNRILNGLRQVQANHPTIITEVRGRGLMIGVEINIAGNPLSGKVFATRCTEKGVYMGYCGVDQNVLRIEPPLIITDAEADFLVTVIQTVANEMENGRIPAETMDKVARFSVGL